MTEPDKDYFTLNEIAAAMRMSPRWVRAELRKGDVEHSRPGGRIRMSADQIEKFRAAYTVGQPTTGKRRSA